MDDGMMEIVKTYTTIEEDINTNLKEFALYTVYNRAIPSAIDGLKPTQRKILYSMLQYPNPTDVKNKVKIADLGSISRYNYHHAETAAQQAAVNMAQAWANNMPIFEGHGNFGSRKVQEAAAPRYVYATLNKNFFNYFKDFSVCPESLNEDDPEPQFYLPIIPWVLVNGVAGVATGFATKILPRKVSDLVKLTKKVVSNPNASIGLVPPSFPDFVGDVTHVEGNTWKVSGKIEESKNGFVITEVPYGEDRAGYVSILNDLCDRNIIADYDDQCSGDGFKFSVKCSRSQKEEILSKDVLKVFKLEKQYTENLTMIGHDGKIKVFDTVEDVIKYFVAYRLTAFEKSIQFDKDKNLSKSNELKDKVKFIKAFINNDFDIKKMTKNELISYIEETITKNEYGKTFVNIPVYNLTKDAVESYENAILDLDTEYINLCNETPTSRFLGHLR